MGINNEKLFRPRIKTGPLNLITDVPGVKIGQVTINQGSAKTGVTAILPHDGDIFHDKVMAGCHVINGFGKSMGLIQIDELGTIETPIVLTNTLSVGTAAEALTKYKVSRNPDIGRKTGTVNPVVLECNDGIINDIRAFHVSEADVVNAIVTAKVSSDHAEFDEGCHGAGTGMICMGLKGGIGSASRVIEVDRDDYTVGALVLTNFGVPGDLIIDGRFVGEEIEAERKARGHEIDIKIVEEDASEEYLDFHVSDELAGEPGEDGKDRGSIIMILATDLPLSERQLKRLSARAAAGLARTGSRFGNGSGDICLSFSTANRVPHYSKKSILDTKMFHDDNIDVVFRAAAEAVEEAIVSSLYHAEATVSYNNKVYYALRDFLKTE